MLKNMAISWGFKSIAHTTLLVPVDEWVGFEKPGSLEPWIPSYASIPPYDHVPLIKLILQKS